VGNVQLVLAPAAAHVRPSSSSPRWPRPNRPPIWNLVEAGIRSWSRAIRSNIPRTGMSCLFCPSASTFAILTMCAMATILFLGGWLPPFSGRTVHLDPGGDLVRASNVCSCFFLFCQWVKADFVPAATATISSCGWVWKVFLPAFRSRMGRNRCRRLAVRADLARENDGCTVY